MKNLVLAALLGAVTASTACTSSTPTDAVVTAKWSFSTFANKDTATDPCPTNFTTASVHSKPWDPVNGVFVPGGVEVIDKFNCSDKIGTTDPLDGIYLIWVSIEDTTGATVYAESESEFFDTIDGDAVVTLPTLFKDAGYMDLSWDLIGSGNTRLSCAAAGIGPSGSVSTTAVSVTNSNSILVDKFTCTDGFGTTDVLKAGAYDVTVTASTGSSDVGASAPIADQLIKAPNGLTHLGHVRIPIGF